MATKKSQPKAQPASEGSNDMWKWLYVAGVVVAGLAAMFFQNPILTLVLILVGILAGVFYFDVENFKEFGIAFLVLGASAGALSAIPVVGTYLTGFFSGVLGFLGPVALTLLVRLFVKRNF